MAIAPFPGFESSQWHNRPIDLAARAHDASHYLIEPQAVLVAKNTAEVRQAMLQAGAASLPVTFRSGGTSLSGQAQGGGLVVDVRQAFKRIEVSPNGTKLSSQPGATLRLVNTVLAHHGRILGPDPASEMACTIGGVVANNSSGMTCGTEFNSYTTLESIVVVLASGTIIDTAAPDADQRLRLLEPDLYKTLTDLRQRVINNPRSMSTIRQQYSMKNTMGYGVNALVDFEHPSAILAHLMVGSEGTLGFIASVTLRTLPIQPYQATALLVFPGLLQAAAAVEPLRQAAAATVELEDWASIRAAQAAAPAGDPIHQIKQAGAAALLVDARAESAGQLEHDLAALRAALPRLQLSQPTDFSTDTAKRTALWASRKGLYTAVAGRRPPGSTALLEDIAVPGVALPATCQGLQGLFTEYKYGDGVVFGHAKDGNVHFMISLQLDQPAELKRYEQFTDAMVDLVLDARGTLKAEHGTGRIMTPFVRRQFGDELYDVMWRIKAAFDPAGRLSPGVILNSEPRAHLTHLKATPPTAEAIDRCVECGYCEPSCPARDLTTTPRQRIALLRTMSQLPANRRAAWIKQFNYLAVETCAADSLCALACPVGIDTGKLMKTWRAARLGPFAQFLGVTAAKHWAGLVTALRLVLRLAGSLPKGLLGGVSRAARLVLPSDWIPQAGPDLPGPGPARRPSTTAPSDPPGPNQSLSQSPDLPGPGRARQPTGTKALTETAVYFSTCINSLFGPAQPGTPGVSQALVQLCASAGLTLRIPQPIAGLCCGTVWQSKGLVRGHRVMAEAVCDALWEATQGGRLVVIAEAASCSHGLTELGQLLEGSKARQYSALKILDAVSFTRQKLLPRLNLTTQLDAIAVHPTCSTAHLGSTGDLLALAQAAGREVFVPDNWGCCGFAGDRGMLHPELTRAATMPEASAIAQAERARTAAGLGQPDGRFDAYVSCNRTCELGISRATGRTYRHILEVLAELAA
ncbi:MAG: FAD-binding oxidoreductase [Bifidobacteriaceae bacterium]|jgi:D-lactate dehydrogenase|nr:FAD-binding oxidoreductase [Bifidobacteriaceae bacterium]